MCDTHYMSCRCCDNVSIPQYSNVHRTVDKFLAIKSCSVFTCVGQCISVFESTKNQMAW